MEFGWTPEQEDYRCRVKQALDDLLPSDWDETYVPESYASDLQIEFSREFCAKLAERGLLVPHWPAAFGGSDRPDWDHFILGEEMKAAGEPRGPQYMNVNWIGPTLMKYGTPEQQAEHVAGIASGKVIWCQGFSEPNAGTDLAALRTPRRAQGRRLCRQRIEDLDLLRPQGRPGASCSRGPDRRARTCRSSWCRWTRPASRSPPSLA